MPTEWIKMSKKMPLLAALVLLPLGAALGDSVTTGDQNNLEQLTSVNITQVMPVGSDEYILLYNAGDKQPSLEGWMLTVGNSTKYTLPDFSIFPLTSARIHFGQGISNATDVYLNQGENVLNDTTGNIQLKDFNGGLVSSISY